jgi:hypothetical protein
MQTSIAMVYERAALTARGGQAIPEEFIDEICLDGVLSSMKNTISPLPVNDCSTKRYSDCARKTPSPGSPVANGGFVGMTGDSSDNDLDADNGMSPSKLKTPPSKSARKRQKRQPFGSPKTTNPWATRVLAIKKEKPSWVDDVDKILGSTKDYVCAGSPYGRASQHTGLRRSNGPCRTSIRGDCI